MSSPRISFWHGSGAIRVAFVGKGGPSERELAIKTLLPTGVLAAWLEQVHSATVLDATPGSNGQGDALITDRAGLALAIVTADCLPILVAGPTRIAAIHAGWRGLVAGIIPHTLQSLGERPESVWIGPAIGGRRYEVGTEVAAAIATASDLSVLRLGAAGRPVADLPRAAEIQLRRAGVERIVQLPLCTFDSPDLLWSYRRDGADAGRNLALIWRNP